VRDRIGERPDERVAHIEVTAIEAFRANANPIGDVLPDTELVIDYFHAIRLASTAVSDVRRRLPRDTPPRPHPAIRSTGSAVSCRVTG
jgi:transposase